MPTPSFVGMYFPVRLSIAAPGPWLFYYSGHHYQVVEDDSRNWNDALTNAKTRIYRGWAVGYLAYFETRDENDDIGALTGATDYDYWIGLSSPGSRNYKVLLVGK
jgi:hypothetical protein